MASKTLNLTSVLYDYLLQNSLREADVLCELRTETQHLPGARMQISPEQGQFMALLIEILQAKKTLDIGTFTGYSALVVALALPENGKVITCDIDEKITRIAEKFWQKAGVLQKIDLRLGPALATLDHLLSQEERGSFDFIFIDADKNRYIDYYERAVDLLRPGGLIAVDNVLQNGRVADLSHQESATQTIRTLNLRILHDTRVSISMLPISDGLTLVRKH